MVMRPPVRGHFLLVPFSLPLAPMSAIVAHRSAAGVHVPSPETSYFWALALFFLILRHTGCQANPSRNFDAALFWIPAFAGMTSCLPSDGVYPELVEGLRTGSGGHPGSARFGKPATDLVKAASALCAV